MSIAFLKNMISRHRVSNHNPLQVGDEKVDRAKELIVVNARALAPEIKKTFSLGQ